MCYSTLTKCHKNIEWITKVLLWRISSIPGLSFSRRLFLYHVISGKGTPWALHSNFRVLLLFTCWFVKFWVSQGRFRATIKTHKCKCWRYNRFGRRSWILKTCFWKRWFSTTYHQQWVQHSWTPLFRGTGELGICTLSCCLRTHYAAGENEKWNVLRAGDWTGWKRWSDWRSPATAVWCRGSELPDRSEWCPRPRWLTRAGW